MSLNAYIVLVILLVLLAFIHYYQRNLSWLKVLVALISFGVFLFISVCVSGNSDKIPWITKEDSETVTVENNGVMYISYGSATLSHKCYMSDGVEKDKVAFFLEKANKPIIVCILDGENMVYSKRLGKLTEDDAEKVLTLYREWKESGSVPRSKTRYNLWFLHVDL